MSDPADSPQKVDPADAAVLIALAVRFQRGWVQRNADIALKAEVEARMAATVAELEKVRAGVTAFGMDATKDGWFGPIRDAVGRDAFDKAMDDAGLYLYWADHYDALVAASAAKPEIEVEILLPAIASVRELVLERLRLAGNTGTSAAEIRSYIEGLRQTHLHDKTIGMTLYRLSLDGVARRDKRTWFFVPEAKNPGGGTPGLINRENKEGEEP